MNDQIRSRFVAEIFPVNPEMARDRDLFDNLWADFYQQDHYEAKNRLRAAIETGIIDLLEKRSGHEPVESLVPELVRHFAARSRFSHSESLWAVVTWAQALKKLDAAGADAMLVRHNPHDDQAVAAMAGLGGTTKAAGNGAAVHTTRPVPPPAAAIPAFTQPQAQRLHDPMPNVVPPARLSRRRRWLAASASAAVVSASYFLYFGVRPQQPFSLDTPRVCQGIASGCPAPAAGRLLVADGSPVSYTVSVEYRGAAPRSTWMMVELASRTGKRRAVTTHQLHYSNGVLPLVYELTPGEYECRFLVDGATHGSLRFAIQKGGS